MNTERRANFYQIHLRGKLDPEQISWFPELTHIHTANGNTLLKGELPDQAALIGVLFRAHNLNLQILSMKCRNPGHDGHNYSAVEEADS
jgi:hypothetical protein